MSEVKARPLSKAQLNVIRNMLSARLRVLKSDWSRDRAEKYRQAAKVWEAERAAYVEKSRSSALAEVRRRPSTYVMLTHDGVSIDKEKLGEYVTKKFGPLPEQPKNPMDEVDVEFPAFANEHGYHATVVCPREFKDQLEALSMQISNAVLSGAADGLVEAIANLGK